MQWANERISAHQPVCQGAYSMRTIRLASEYLAQSRVEDGNSERTHAKIASFTEWDLRDGSEVYLWFLRLLRRPGFCECHDAIPTGTFACVCVALSARESSVSAIGGTVDVNWFGVFGA